MYMPPKVLSKICHLSGRYSCSSSFSDILYMVVGGYDSSGSLADVELVSLDPDNNPVPPCLTNLNNFPVELEGAAGSVDEGKVKLKAYI